MVAASPEVHEKSRRGQGTGCGTKQATSYTLSAVQRSVFRSELQPKNGMLYKIVTDHYVKNLETRNTVFEFLWRSRADSDPKYHIKWRTCRGFLIMLFDDASGRRPMHMLD